MIAEYYERKTPSIDIMSAQTSLLQSDTGLTSAQLKALAKFYKVNLLVVNTLTISEIKKQIDTYKPVLMLISYRYVYARQNQNDFGGHFVVVTGYDDKFIYVNDPDWWGSLINKGRCLAIPILEFEKAIQYSPVPYQGLIVI